MSTSFFTSDELEAGFVDDDESAYDDIACGKCSAALTPDEIDCSAGRDEQPLCDACWLERIPGYRPSSERGGK